MARSGIDPTMAGSWNDPMEEVDCFCPDAFLDNGLTVDYCPRHGENPDWSLVNDGLRERQQQVWRENR